MNTIELLDFSCFYQQGKDYITAIDHLTCSIEAGELLVVVGRSGSGKTSLIKSILGMMPFIEGDLLIGGIRIDDYKVKDHNVAFVRQEIALYPHLTIYENIAFPLRSMKTPQPEIDRRVKEVAGLMDIDWLLTRKPRQLSGGQQQRVAIARALIKNPDIILLDEPFSNVEPETRMALRKLIKKIHSSYRSTIIFVTHDLSEAFFLADRILVLEEGRLAGLGTPQELQESPPSDLIKDFLLS